MTTPSDTSSIQLRVHRGGGPQTPMLQDYEVPAHAAASLLDGLRWLRANADDTLAFRYSCINANACKECMVRLDGKTVYACTAKLEPGRTYDVAPLPNKRLVRDLVTEIAPSKERLFEGEDGDGD
ncbi:2Fe-2S iron-sulfur cluster-binding protein [Ottowia thiooxydans]|uniref:succinate dehydrogenase n=1 Tax=Ottowia thiooxydans TaxID=219182 RepID=A0ABV2QGM6_9BURK